MNQALQPNLKKLQWQCRRGMLELDVILIPFLESHFADLTGEKQSMFSDLLEEADPDLYTWIMNFGECDKPELLPIIELIREKMAIA